MASIIQIVFPMITYFGPFLIRKVFRSKETTNNYNLMAVEHNQQFYVFVRNLSVNVIINQFKIKCDNEWNGCNTVLELVYLTPISNTVSTRSAAPLASEFVAENKDSAALEG